MDNTTSYTYDSLNRLTSQTDAEDATTTYAYDEAGNLHSLTDADGNTTTWSYDLLGRCLEETNPLGDHEYYSYDPSGRLLSKTDYDGRTTTYTYDGLGRETAENWLDSSQNVIQSFGYSYDLVGDLLSESDPAASYSYAYNVLGRSTTITQSIAGLTPTVTLAQQFDADGDRTQLSATIGQTADFMNNYAYNGLGQMTQVTQSGATGGDAVAEKRIDISYDAAGQFNTVSRYADLAGTELVAESDYTYDLAGQLTALDHHQGTTDLENYTWTYDQAGNMTASTSSLDGAVSYSNDATGQLTGADYDYQTNESYTYDATGNRTNTGYTTGTGNRLLSDGTYTYTYNAEGNRTAKFIDTNADGVLDSGDTDVTTYTWDYRDRLTEVDHFAAYGDQADQVVKYTYDYANRLVGRSLDANGDGTVDSSTAYVYDGNQIALQFDHAGTGAATASDLSHRYLWGPAVDQLLADEQMSPLQPDQGEGFDQSTPGNVVWPLTDNLGTIRDLATYDSNSGVTSIANHRVYDAYGNLTSQTNSAVDCVFGYTGKMLDDATGLQNNVNRWYDAKIGRLTSNDPIGADVNLYRYSNNSPLTHVDPMGLWVWPWAPTASWNPNDTVSLWSGIDTAQLPHGGGTFFGENLELGAGPLGVGEQGQAGWYSSFNGDISTFRSWGGFIPGAGGGNNSMLFPNPNQVPPNRNGCCPGSDYGAIGFSGGIGVGAFVSNATTPSDLRCAFMNYSLNTPLGSVQYSIGGDIWSVSISTPALGFSVSKFPTYTWVR